MERTISAMIGKGSVNHNTRAFTAKNVDKNRSADNVEFCQEDIKQVYHKLFDEARERYNAKQKRKDRMIDNYYDIRTFLYSGAISPSRSRKVRKVNAGLSPMGVFRNCVYFWLIPCAEIAIARMMLALASPAWSVELNNRHSTVPW